MSLGALSRLVYSIKLEVKHPIARLKQNYQFYYYINCYSSTKYKAVSILNKVLMPG
jgi:hypothetical protein